MVQAARSTPSLTLGPLVLLDRDDLVFNPWNPNKMDGFMYSKAVESIQRFGMVDPVLVRDKGRKNEVIDGEHRARACIDLGMQVPAHSVGVIDDSTAKRLTIALNEIHGTADPADMGALLNELLADSSVDDLLRGLPMTEDTVKAFAAAADIVWPSVPQESPATPVPETSAGSKERWVERTYRVPSSVADVLDEAVRKAKSELGPDATDAQALEVIAAEYMAG